MEDKKLAIKNNSQILLYQTQDGQTKIEVKLKNETIWLTQKQMAELFGKDKDTIGVHIKNIYNSAELNEISTTEDYSVVQKEGNRMIGRSINFYNLDMIISVGYRVNSIRGTQFRIWATQKLREYIIKGFVLDDERLKEGKTINGINYFNELLERVREIRASEKNLYDKVKDIFATSIDYNSKDANAKEFYAAVQNKFHFAITGKTAAEIIVDKIDSRKNNLGLTNWQGKEIRRKDAEIAKNYLPEKKLEQLALLVEQFLVYAEFQIKMERPMYMKNWKEQLDEFLKFNKLKILEGKGKISHKKMGEIVKKEFLKIKGI